jgi:hypothetical protein
VVKAAGLLFVHDLYIAERRATPLNDCRLPEGRWLDYCGGPLASTTDTDVWPPVVSV